MVRLVQRPRGPRGLMKRHRHLPWPSDVTQTDIEKWFHEAIAFTRWTVPVDEIKDVLDYLTLMGVQWNNNKWANEDYPDHHDDAKVVYLFFEWEDETGQTYLFYREEMDDQCFHFEWEDQDYNELI